MATNNTEKETIINYNEAEPLASVYTHNKALINKLMRLMLSRPKDIRVVKRFCDGAIEFAVPKKWCKVTPPRTYTDAQKEKMSAQLAKYKFQK